MNSSTDNDKRPPLAAIIFAMVFPTILTWVYFVSLSHSPAAVQQGTYGVGKFIQFSFPLLATLLLIGGGVRSLWSWHDQQFPGDRINANRAWLIAIGFGALIAIAVVGGYVLIRDLQWIDAAFTDRISEKVSGMNLNTPMKFIAVGVFYALLHSYLEEYYWRWFVFRNLSKWLPELSANVLSSLGFMSHHVILLATFFGWSSPLTLICSFSIAFGGFVWAWLYSRSGRLVYPWVSHMLADAAIFCVGYGIVFGGW